MTLFKDRIDAGEQLARSIHLNGTDSSPIVLGIPRGGVEVGYPVALELGCPLDALTLRKLPLPWNDQMGFGAVTIDRKISLNKGLLKLGYLSDEDVQSIVDDEYRELLRREKAYRGKRPFPNLKGRSVIIVDDGLATGYTMLAAIGHVRAFQPRKVIVAVPVAHFEAYEQVRRKADIMICLHVEKSESFAVASFYDSFPDLPDQRIVSLLKRKTVSLAQKSK